MALPNIDIKYIPVQLPSGKKVNIRPFTGKEEKAILMAKAGLKGDDLNKSVIEILSGCIKEDVGNLHMLDIEWIFIQLRGISISPDVDPMVMCSNDECGHEIKMKISVSDIEMPKLEKTQEIIEVGEDGKGNLIKMVINLPKFSNVVELDPSDKNSERDLIWSCLEGIYIGADQETDFTKDEVYEWILGLEGVYILIMKFLSDSPSIELEKEWECPECGHENTLHLRGMNSFFI